MSDKKTRCPWCEGSALMEAYHDTEWGTPLHDERLHFEFLCLEAMQAGLSWMVVLQKREAFRKAFAGFDPEQVALFGPGEVESLLEDPGIIRNRRKIEALISNARCFLEVQKQFGSFDAYIWGFTGGKPVKNRWEAPAQVPVTTDLSDTVARDLKARGFKFLGSTTIYAHLQAIGVVNDHLVSCFRYREVG